MEFGRIVEAYEQLEQTSKRSQKTAIVAELLKESPFVDRVLLLLQGSVFEGGTKTQLGFSSSYAIKSLAIASGYSKDEITQIWKQTGDLGLTAQTVMSKKRQVTLFSDILSINKIFSSLQKIPSIDGAGSVDQKVKIVADLFASSQGVEAKYIMRLVLEVLRLGVGPGIIRDALVWTYLPAVNYIFEYDTTAKITVPTAAGFERIDDHKYVSLDSIDGSKEETDDKEVAFTSDVDMIIASSELIAREIYNHFVTVVQHAIDLTNDVSFVARCLESNKREQLLHVSPQLGKPIQVMLAKKAADSADAVSMVGLPCMVEYKYDGFRVEIHFDAQAKEVTIFTRRFENVTEQFPDVVSLLLEQLKVTCILDCEIVGFNPQTNIYQPFQHISRRIRRKYDINTLVKELPVELNVFDIILVGTENYVDKAFEIRRKKLQEIIPTIAQKIRPSQGILAQTVGEIDEFYQESLAAGNEGVMCKTLSSPYKPGARVGHMIKLKPIMETLDLVVTGATWGEGKRANWLTSFTLCCVNDADLVEIGKVGTGFKELDGEELSFAHMTNLLEPLILTESGRDITVKPQIVLEVSFEEIQLSTSYSSGFALRFPRVVRLRTGRDAQNASDISYVEDLYEQQ